MQSTFDAVPAEFRDPAYRRRRFQNWMIALASMMIGMVRRSILDASWFPKYFTEAQGVAETDRATDPAYQFASWGIAILGILGGFALGALSDFRFKSRRAPAVVFGFLGMILSLLLFYLSDYFELGKFAGAGCLILLSFFVNGAHGLIGGH